MKKFESSILVHPGLGNSLEGHWQTIWENNLGFTRIAQDEWESPVRDHWMQRLDEHVTRYDASNVIIVGHSLACNTIVAWAEKYRRKIKGALLVAPSDTEAPSYPAGTTGFVPMPLFRLPFHSIVITSDNDFYVSLARANQFADAWGSTLYNIGDAGHINVASGHGQWNDGLKYLEQLDRA